MPNLWPLGNKVCLFVLLPCGASPIRELILLLFKAQGVENTGDLDTQVDVRLLSPVLRCTGYEVHWVWGTLSVWCTGYVVHCVYGALGMWCTMCMVHWVYGTLIIWCTGYLVHCVCGPSPILLQTSLHLMGDVILIMLPLPPRTLSGTHYRPCKSEIPGQFETSLPQ